jgi:hypothetical protein
MTVLSNPDDYAPDWQPPPLPEDPEEAAYIESLLGLDPPEET